MHAQGALLVNSAVGVVLLEQNACTERAVPPACWTSMYVCMYVCYNVWIWIVRTYNGGYEYYPHAHIHA